MPRAKVGPPAPSSTAEVRAENNASGGSRRGDRRVCVGDRYRRIKPEATAETEVRASYPTRVYTGWKLGRVKHVRRICADEVGPRRLRYGRSQLYRNGPGRPDFAIIVSNRRRKHPWPHLKVWIGHKGARTVQQVPDPGGSRIAGGKACRVVPVGVCEGVLVRLREPRA